MPFQKTKMPELSVEEFAKDLKKLGSFTKISEKYGVSKGTISYYFKKLNIPYKHKVSNYDVNHNFFANDDEKSFYWAGFLAADGCISVRKNFNNKNVILNLGEKDLCHLQKFKDDIKSKHTIKSKIVKNSKRNPNWNDRKINSITIGSHKLVNDLSRFNIVPRKTKIYDFPNWLISHNLVHHFMRGYFDGDGNIFIVKINNRKNQYRLSIAGNLSFLNNFGNIICNNVNFKNKSICFNGGINVLSYGGNNLTKKVGSYLYNNATIFLNRKYDLWKECCSDTNI
jgi:hypothetical protein